MCRRRAFTLIELLVVIGIIMILAALLFPVFARAKQQAKQTHCLSNLKQIGASILMYMADNDDLFPHAVDASDKYRPEIWDAYPEFKARIPYMPLMHQVLQDYIKSQELFRCPSDTGSRVLDNHPGIEFETAPTMYATYKSSYLFRTEIAFKYFTSTSFRLPAEVNVLFDGAGHWHGSVPVMRLDYTFQEYARFRKEARYNTLYGDMHAKSLNFDQLQRAWDTDL